MATVERERPATDRADLPEAAREFLPERRKFNVDEYLRMGEEGIIEPEEHVELIDGEIIVMCPIGNRHSGCVTILTNALAVALAGRALVSPQNPLRVSRHSEPQPDLTLVRPRADGYTRAHPKPADVLFAIEVMESSARYDRGVKIPMYARAGVPEVWLVDLNRDQVETYRQPQGDAYAECRVFGRGEMFGPAAFPDVLLRVDDVLGG
jgi:Uma2 family endonuclease